MTPCSTNQTPNSSKQPRKSERQTCRAAPRVPYSSSRCLTCMFFMLGAVSMQTGQRYRAWPAWPPNLSWRPALPPPMLHVAACTLA